MEIFVIQSSKTFKNIGLILAYSGRVEYRGSNPSNHDALRTALTRTVMVEDMDDDGNIYSVPMELKSVSNVRTFLNNLPTFWFIASHIKTDTLDKDALYKSHIHDNGQSSTIWAQV